MNSLICITKYSKIKEYEGKFVNPKDQWSLISVINDKSLTQIIKNSLFQKLIRTVNNTCVLVSKSLDLGNLYCVL